MLKKALLDELATVTRTMVQGGLSSTTRTCGKPQCPCHIDSSHRHGPNLCLTYGAEGKSHALYIPPKHADEAKAAEAAWARFGEIGCELAAGNREQMCNKWKRPARIASRETA
jgi:hypothetical protein